MNAVVDALAPLAIAHIDMPATPEKSGARFGAHRTRHRDRPAVPGPYEAPVAIAGYLPSSRPRCGSAAGRRYGRAGHAFDTHQILAHGPTRHRSVPP